MFSKRFTRVTVFFCFAVAMIFGQLTSSSARTMTDDELQSGRHDPKRTLIRNAAMVITMDPALGEGPLGILENADVLMEGDTIKGTFEREINGAPLKNDWDARRQK